MAERRMFSKSVTNTDRFLKLSPAAQLLYFHLSMNADDDGIVANPKYIAIIVGATDATFAELEGEGYIYAFDSGNVVIRNWLQNNKIRNDRRKATVFTADFSKLTLSENDIYFMKNSDGDGCRNCQPICQPNCQPECQHSIDKDSKDKFSKGYVKAKKGCGVYGNVMLSDEDYSKLKAECGGAEQADALIERMSSYLKSNGKSYTDYLAALRMWRLKDEREEKKEKSKKSAGTADGFIKRSYDFDKFTADEEAEEIWQ